MIKKWTVVLSIFCLLVICHSGCNKKTNEIIQETKETGTKLFLKFKKSAGKNDLLYLRNKINTYKRQNGRYPESLQQLVNEGIIEKIPEPPPGMQYIYDPATGRISLK
ncbi:MAG: type II secretion system protein GspG [Candidatus Omnitrophica bacterium]|nr:type II secretion system protein GspG [Candidatus Omnitrophota bacterium]MCM8816309.1 type II secretion system protein GspG [Candidatus Omnitrophota bacterium]